ncbi:hypothetical protein KAR91_05350 [Candidatus Pacearchaeota archaeon]|nr:hypothetical protein [Candidatus Pacearchaeota archaeon]
MTNKELRGVLRRFPDDLVVGIHSLSESAFFELEDRDIERVPASEIAEESVDQDFIKLCEI